MLECIFTSSPYLMVLELLLENPETYMNLREIAKKVNKNPGTIARVVRKLLEKNIVDELRIGERTRAFKLNKKNEKVNLTLKYLETLKDHFKNDD